MNIFKKIKKWFWNTKPVLGYRIENLLNKNLELKNRIEEFDDKLWKEVKFKEDYRDRLTRYYDECIELRKKIKKYNSILKRCKKFKGVYGRSCSKFILEMTRGTGTTGPQGSNGNQ